MCLPHVFQAVEHKRIYADQESCAKAFAASPHEPIDVFLRELPRFGGYGIGLVKGPFLRIRTRSLFVREASTAYFTDMHSIGISRLREACWSHGHLSVMFVSEQPDAILDHYLTLQYYRRKGKTIQLGNGSRADPLGIRQAALLCELVQSYRLKEHGTMFSFSHDADYFYNVSLS